MEERGLRMGRERVIGQEEEVVSEAGGERGGEGRVKRKGLGRRGLMGGKEGGMAGGRGQGWGETREGGGTWGRSYGGGREGTKRVVGRT